MRIGALEAGGTKMVCAVGDETGMIFERTRIPTTMPEETLNALVEWFQDKEIEALGIGCFGPVDLRRSSKTYVSRPRPSPAGPGAIWWGRFVGRWVSAWGLIPM